MRDQVRGGVQAAFTAALLLLAPPPARADKTYVVPGILDPADKKSKELEALTAEEANQVARRDLLSVLQPTGAFRAEPLMPVDGNVWGMTFVTWPYPTKFESVCREDAVTLHYTLVYDEGRGGHWEREPQSVDTKQLFHVGQLPVKWAGQIATCDKQHPGEKANFFAAPGELDAARAANMFRTAEDQVKSGDLKPEPCSLKEPEACRKWVVSLDDLSKISSVEPCDDSGDELCYVISIGGDELTIRAKTSDTNSYDPTAIISIQVDKVMYMTE